MGDEAGEPRGTRHPGMGHGCTIARDGVLGQGKSGWWRALQEGPGPGERGAVMALGRQEPDRVCAPGTEITEPLVELSQTSIRPLPA